MSDENLVHEVPSSLKQLARLVVRGFYTIEDALIIDMLVRNPCMKEDDICELLRFEKKMLRARISQLRNDKFIQVRLRMDTGTDGKAQKLDIMRKRLETEERDATSRASFKCIACMKTFTDLEVDQLFDYMAQEFRCTYCGELVEEDASALPKKDSRLLLAKFNEQLDQLYMLLREVEGIKLAPEVLEPEPVDINTIKGIDKKFNPATKEWSGEASRNSGFLLEETRIDVTFGDERNKKSTITKEAPIWMTESTVIPDTNNSLQHIVGVDQDSENSGGAMAVAGVSAAKNEDILNVLLAHEKHSLNTNSTNSAIKNLTNQDSDSDDQQMSRNHQFEGIPAGDEIETMETDDEEDDSNIPTVNVGNKTYPVTDINDDIINKMTQSEKEIYVHVFQDYYSHMNY